MVLRVSLVAATAVLWTGCARLESPGPIQCHSALGTDFRQDIPIVDSQGRKPEIAFFGESYESPHPRIELAVWEDGHILWSSGSEGMNERRYCLSRISPETIQTVLFRMDAQGVFRAFEGKIGYAVPDSGFDAVIISTGTFQLNMISVHEGIERDQDLVATTHGIENLQGRNRDQVLAGQPEQYRRFRAIWGQVKAAIRPLIPEGCPEMARVEEIHDPNKDHRLCVRW